MAAAARAIRAVVLAVQDDVDRFAGCTRALAVAIRTGATVDVAPLRELETITGDLQIGPTVGVTTITLPALRAVGGAIRVTSNGSLRGLFLPLVERAGRVEVDHDLSLTTIALPRLAAVAESFVVTDNRELALVDASALVSVGNELVLGDDPKLVTVLAPHLTHAGAVRIERAPKLADELAAKLRAAAAP